MLCLVHAGGSNHCFWVSCSKLGSWQVHPPEASAVEKLLLKEVEGLLKEVEGCPKPRKERNSPALKCRWCLRVFSLGEWSPASLTMHHSFLLLLLSLQSTCCEDALDTSAVALQGWGVGSIFFSSSLLWLLQVLHLEQLESLKQRKLFSLLRTAFTGLAVVVLHGYTSKSHVCGATGSNIDSYMEPARAVKTGRPVGFFCHGLQVDDKALFFYLVGMVIPTAGGSHLAF